MNKQTDVQRLLKKRCCRCCFGRWVQGRFMAELEMLLLLHHFLCFVVFWVSALKKEELSAKTSFTRTHTRIHSMLTHSHIHAPTIATPFLTRSCRNHLSHIFALEVTFSTSGPPFLLSTSQSPPPFKSRLRFQPTPLLFENARREEDLKVFAKGFFVGSAFAKNVATPLHSCLKSLKKKKSSLTWPQNDTI